MAESRALASRVYAWPGQSLRVETDEPAHLDWLGEFLQPSFCVPRSASADVCVRLVRDAARHQAASAAGGTGEDLNAFVLDSRVMALPEWRVAEGRRALDEKHSVFHTVDATGTRVQILQAAPGLAVRNPLMRVVRELAMGRARKAGTLFLHAACVSLGGKGVIIAAPKRGGKSTLLTHAMRADSAGYVGNDRVGVFWADDGPRLRGVPVIVCLREEALQFTPGLRRDLVDNWYRWQLSLDECRQRPDPPPRPWLDGRFGVTPAQYCALMGKPRVGSVEPDVVLFPAITGRPGSVRLVPLAEAETAEGLRRSVFGARHIGARSDLFDPPLQRSSAEQGAEAEYDVADQCAELARRMRGYRCELGTDVRYARSTGNELEAGLEG